MGFLRQSTNKVIKLPKQLDSTDGNTPETGLTINNTDIILWKNGSVSGVPKNSGGATHSSLGDYYCTLDSTDTDTLGELLIETHKSGALYTRSAYTILPQIIYDSIILGTDYLDINLTQILGTSLTETSTGYLSNSFKKLLDVSTPVFTVESVNQTDDIGLNGAGLTAIGDTRLSNLDTTISSRSTLTAQQVWEYATRTLSSMGTLVSDIWGYATRTLSAFSFNVTASSVTDKTGYSLSITPPTAEQIRTEIDSNSIQLSAIKAKTDNLPSGIKKGVAIQNFVFLMKDSSDHITGKTGLTVTGQILKDNGSFASITGTITEIAYGAYRVNEISATETNADIFTLRFSATGADDTFIEIKTV